MPDERPALPIIAGPTASGKSGVAMALAQTINGSIISSDSRQIYQELTIGSAKPTRQDRARVPHFLIDELTLGASYSAGQFQACAEAAVEQSLAQGLQPIVVGGSTLYVDALINGLPNIPEVPSSLRARVQALYQSEGLVGLIEALGERDPDILERIDVHNPRRLMRALEVVLATRKSWSVFWESRTAFKFPVSLYILSPPRPQLYDAINRRVDRMIAEGLIEEVRHVYQLVHGDTTVQALQTLGYAETLAFLGHAIPFEQLQSLIKQNTRRYAKRQITWYKRYATAQWYETPSALFKALQQQYGSPVF